MLTLAKSAGTPAVTNETDNPPVVDFEARRRARLHMIHDARLEKMRSEFEKAFPLPGKPAAKPAGSSKKNSKKKKKPRKS